MRINGGIPWPVHWSSVVLGAEKIDLATFPPYPGLGIGQYIQAVNGICFGSFVRLGPGVKLISGNHCLDDYEDHIESAPIVIGDHCWIGANATILPGVQLGAHVIVAAGAVVTKSFTEPDIILAGVPAKKIKKLNHYRGLEPPNAVYRNPE